MRKYYRFEIFSLQKKTNKKKKQQSSEISVVCVITVHWNYSPEWQTSQSVLKDDYIKVIPLHTRPVIRLSLNLETVVFFFRNPMIEFRGEFACEMAGPGFTFAQLPRPACVWSLHWPNATVTTCRSCAPLSASKCELWLTPCIELRDCDVGHAGRDLNLWSARWRPECARAREAARYPIPSDVVKQGVAGAGSCATVGAWGQPRPPLNRPDFLGKAARSAKDQEKNEKDTKFTQWARLNWTDQPVWLAPTGI